jgi:transcriptional regulator of acetoin/glycerol metabolism
LEVDMGVEEHDRQRWSVRDRILSASGVGDLESEKLIRAEIQDSWRRCLMSGTSRGSDEIPYSEDLPADSRLRRAADPVVASLAQQLADSPATIVLADSGARIVDRRAGVRELRERLDRASVAMGFQYSEEFTGTNGIGTALEERRLFSVKGGEHYREALQNLACVGKPIMHPISRGVEGILNITCSLSDVSALMAPLVEAAVREIEQRLYEMASHDERALLEGFLRASRRGTSAVVMLSSDLVMANPAASRLLQPEDKTFLWHWASSNLRTGDEFHGSVQLADMREVLAKVRRLEDGSRTMGIILELSPVSEHQVGRAANVDPQTARTHHRPDERPSRQIPGRSKATRRLDEELELVAQDPGATLITGEDGVGKLYAARYLHQRWSYGRDADDLTEYNLAVVDAETVPPLLSETAVRLRAGSTVVLRHLEGLSADAMMSVVGLIEQANQAAWKLIVTGPETPEGPPARAHAHFRRRIAVAPLARRVDEIEDIVAEILRLRAPDRPPQRFQPVTLQTLMARRWPGNIRELKSVVESAAARALGGDIGLQHLPAGYRNSSPGKAMSALERAELETLMTTLQECRGNKSLAAQKLGVARSTLYRKVREYGLDKDRFVILGGT